MKLIAQVKLNPSKEQAKALKKTLVQANAACNAISETAWKSHSFKPYHLHKLVYSQIRAAFDLSAQIVVRGIAKVANAYKPDKNRLRRFKPLGAIAYDDRILTWRVEQQIVTIWTVAGRQTIPFACGARQQQLLESRQGESDLVYHKGNFFLLAVCDVSEPTTGEIEDVLGVDFGIVNLATDSLCNIYSGKAVDAVRARTQKLKKKLQSKGTKSAKRHLQKLSGRERRFKRDTNHRISRLIVRTAKDTNRAIAIEDLSGIGSRITVTKAQRERFGKWAFGELRRFLEYKATLAGIPVVAVDPRNTSRTCHLCGHIAIGNRQSQSKFACLHCCFSTNADYNAACNIAARALVDAPIVARESAWKPIRGSEQQAVAL